MKILHQGILPENEEFQVVCQNCKTMFVFERREAISGHDRDGSYLKVNCPLCKKEVWKGLK